MAVLLDDDVIVVKQLALDRQSEWRTPADPVRAGLSTFFDFGAAGAIQTIFTVATVAPAPAPAGSVSRCRITGIHSYALNATLVLPYDGGALAANRIFTQLTLGAGTHLLLGPQEIPPGGILIATDFRLDPSANNYEVTVFYTAEYDLPYMA